MFLIDLLWLGVIAQPIYDEALGPLKRQQVYWPAAIAFYVMYIGAIVIHAVVLANSVKTAPAAEPPDSWRTQHTS